MRIENPFEKVDEYIWSKYSSSSMSSSKWKKLLNGVSDLYEEGVNFYYQDIYEGDIELIHRYYADPQFFAEPLKYQEVEWVEFPAEYEDLVNPNNRKAGTEIKKQNIEIIRNTIPSIGKFDIEDEGHAIRIYAYR